MPKPAIIAAGVVGAVVVIGGGIFLATNMMKSDSQTSTTSSSNSSKTTINDPNGDYDFFSDPSVTKYPEKNVVFGNGQTLTFEYDGSKSNNDEYATLSYQLYYIQENGSVQPMGGGNVTGTGGKGTFTLSDKVFDSNAKDRNGFLELQVTFDSSVDDNNKISATTKKLGMYPIKFDVSE